VCRKETCLCAEEKSVPWTSAFQQRVAHRVFWGEGFIFSGAGPGLVWTDRPRKSGSKDLAPGQRLLVHAEMWEFKRHRSPSHPARQRLPQYPLRRRGLVSGESDGPGRIGCKACGHESAESVAHYLPHGERAAKPAPEESLVGSSWIAGAMTIVPRAAENLEVAHAAAAWARYWGG